MDRLSRLFARINETVYDPAAVLERLDAFRQHNELCTLVASTRDASASIEGFERWHMPPLPSRRVKGQLTRVPLYGELDGAGRELVEQACRNPLFLSMLTEVGDDDVPFDLDAGVDAARQLIVERAVRRRLGWSVGERPTPEAAFSSWLAHAMRALSLGSTLELRYVVWTMLPPLVQRRVRALFILVAGAPVITASAIVALVLGLGVPGLLASLLATFLVFAVTYAGMARWPLQPPAGQDADPGAGGRRCRLPVHPPPDRRALRDPGRRSRQPSRVAPTPGPVLRP